MAEYHRLGLNTGEDDDGNRAALARQQARWLEAHPSKPPKYREGDHLPLIVGHVTEGVRAEVRKWNRARYTDQELAVVLYAIELGTREHRNPYHQNTAPNNSLIAIFQRLGMPIQGSPGAVRNRLGAMKRALVRAGLVVELDGGSWTVGKGKAFALGPNHPRSSAVCISLSGGRGEGGGSVPSPRKSVYTTAADMNLED